MNNILDKLERNGFKPDSDIVLIVKSDIYIKYENYDLADSSTQKLLLEKIYKGKKGETLAVAKKLKDLLKEIYPDTLAHPSKVIAKTIKDKSRGCR